VKLNDRIFQRKDATTILSDSTPAFDHVKACIDNEIGSFETETGSGLTWVKNVSYDMACNWKVFVDNYLDGGYHVEILHKDLTTGLDIGSYSTEVGDGFSIQVKDPTVHKLRYSNKGRGLPCCYTTRLHSYFEHNIYY
jgi:phenylpropionate dioxygenase-like ring-hydroxylating dioxygenase large terminal subunit